MSIIYEALQKTQRSREIKTERPIQYKPNRRIAWLDTSIIVTLSLLIIVSLYFYLPKVIKHFSHATPATGQIIDTDNKDNLILNGVFMADDEKVALINNRSYHLGDAVDGMLIVAMDLNGVILENKSRKLVLRVTG